MLVFSYKLEYNYWKLYIVKIKIEIIQFLEIKWFELVFDYNWSYIYIPSFIIITESFEIQFNDSLLSLEIYIICIYNFTYT